MKALLRYCAIAVAVVVAASYAMGQVTKWKEVHKVKRKETIYGIARDNGLTVQELMDANPEMRSPDFQLKKGMTIFIPYPKAQTTETATTQPVVVEKVAADDIRKREIRLGVALPFNNTTAEGQRMVEYYRGVLMACDSLRRSGISVDVHAWNTPKTTGIDALLTDEEMGQCDLIIGPAYQRHVKPLADYALKHGIKVLIPYPISTTEMQTNTNLYQAGMDEATYNEAVIARFLQRFAGWHTVFVDCNDPKSRKGAFTLGLRKRLDAMGRKFSITNLTSAENHFANAFSKEQPNVVVLNTGAAPQLGIAFAKINNITAINPEAKITLFGYTEWLDHTQTYLDNFYKYGVYIPTASYANPLAKATSQMERKYKANFRESMGSAKQRPVLDGFDHTYFFLKGLHTKGRDFNGTTSPSGCTPVQTPMRFERVGGGGYQNKSILMVHYTEDHKIETIMY